MNLIQFDAFDHAGKLIYSEFLDSETGFNVKRVVFDKSGNVLSVLFFFDLKINQKSKPPKVENVKMISVEQFIAKNETFDNVERIEEFSEKVFNEVFK